MTVERSISITESIHLDLSTIEDISYVLKLIMTGITIHPDRTISYNPLRITQVLRLHHYEVMIEGKLYYLFYESTSDRFNPVVSELVGTNVYGPVILIQKQGHQYITPSISAVPLFADGKLKKRDDCNIL